MAANIEVRTIGGIEVPSFVENGSKKRAWHELGTVYDRPLTAVEALKEAHADYEVEMQDVFFPSFELKQMLTEGKDIPADVILQHLKKIEGRKATVRTDYEEALGVVTDSYGIVQNKDAFEFVDILTNGELGGETPTIECAGVLGKGERIFITAKFPEPIKLDDNGNDIVESYIVFSTSHDGISGAVSCMVTPVRVVCQNTLNMAFSKNTGRMNWRHTTHVLDRMDLRRKENAETAFKALNLYKKYTETFKQKLDAMKKLRLSDKNIERALVNSLFDEAVRKVYEANNYSINSADISTKAKNILAGVTEAMHTGIGQDMGEKGTALWAINGLTTFYQNTQKWTDSTKKFDAIMTGSVNRKLNALQDNLFALAS